MKKIITMVIIFTVYVSKAFSNVDCNTTENCNLLIENYKKDLNELFNKLEAKDKDKLVTPSFEKSQILWNKFIKADCSFMNSPMQMSLGDGYIIVYYECLASYYKNRIIQLQKMIDDIE